MQHQITIGFFDEHSAKQGQLKIFKPLKQKQIDDALKGLSSVEFRNNSLVLEEFQQPIPIGETIQLKYLDYRGKLYHSPLEIALALKRELGCTVADYQHGQIFDQTEIEKLMKRASEN